MNRLLKKSGWIFLMIPTLFAYSETMSDRVGDLEKQMKQVRTETDSDTYGAKYASAAPQLTNGTGWFVFADALYWHAKVGGTEFSYSTIGQTGPNNNPFLLPIQGTVAHNEFDWDWGLKAGIGYHFDHDCWDVLGRYTWYATGDSETQAVNRANRIILLKGIGESDDTSIKAKSKFELDYQSGDIELGKNSFVSKFLSMRPFFGLKASWIRLIQSVEYLSGNNNEADGLFSHKVIDQSRFRGLGPRAGIDTTWHLNNGFHLFADASLALLYGEFKVHHRAKNIDFNDPSEEDRTKESVRDEFHRFSPTARLFLGLGWQDNICGGLFSGVQRYQIRIGYEVQYYWRQYQALQENQSTDLLAAGSIGSTPTSGPRYDNISEDVMLYGLTLHFRVDF